MKKISFLSVLLLTACNAVNFSPSNSADTNPSAYNQVLEKDEKIYVDFSFKPNHNAAEKAFSINSTLGGINGNFEWSNEKMTFTPTEDFVPGRRYQLTLAGRIPDSDGKDWDFNICVPFFYKSSDSKIPSISSFFPVSGSTINGYDKVSIDFSVPINQDSLLKGLLITPDIKCSKAWNPGFTHLEIIPEEKWSEGEIYKFSLGTDLKSLDGTPLEMDKQFFLYSSTGTKNPEITAVNGIDNLQFKDEIQIFFSVPMDKTKTENSISFAPSTSGQKYWIDNKTLSFKPENGWICGTRYTLTVSKSAQSDAGLTMLDPFNITFSPNIDYLELCRIEGTAGDGFPISYYDLNSEIDIDTGDTLSVENTYTLGFIFNKLFCSESEKEDVCSKIKLSGVFPSSLGSPKAVSYLWPDNKSLFIKYKDFVPEGRIYKLSISGGENGIMTSDGSFLESDINLILRTR